MMYNRQYSMNYNVLFAPLQNCIYLRILHRDIICTVTKDEDIRKNIDYLDKTQHLSFVNGYIKGNENSLNSVCSDDKK